MRKEKILNWVKENKKSAGVIGGALAAALLIGGGYGIYKYSNKPLQVAENKESNTSQIQEATDENTSDNVNENKDGQKDNEENVQVGNEENEVDSKNNSNTTENTQEKKDDVKKGENKTSTLDGKESVNVTTESENKQESSSNTSSNVTNKPSTNSPSHSHSWTPVTKVVNHKEQGHYENVLVKPAWTEKVPVYEERERSICNGCGKDITSDPDEHMYSALLAGNTKCAGYHSEWKKVQVGTKTVKHEAVYKKNWIVDKKAYNEKVVTGYKCSCGATK